MKFADLSLMQRQPDTAVLSQRTTPILDHNGKAKASDLNSLSQTSLMIKDKAALSDKANYAAKIDKKVLIDSEGVLSLSKGDIEQQYQFNAEVFSQWHNLLSNLAEQMTPSLMTLMQTLTQGQEMLDEYRHWLTMPLTMTDDTVLLNVSTTLSPSQNTQLETTENTQQNLLETLTETILPVIQKMASHDGVARTTADQATEKMAQPQPIAGERLGFVEYAAQKTGQTDEASAQSPLEAALARLKERLEALQAALKDAQNEMNEAMKQVRHAKSEDAKVAAQAQLNVAMEKVATIQNEMLGVLDQIKMLMLKME